jgi:uncharacterized protein YjbI with pentapeptide repeats
MPRLARSLPRYCRHRAEYVPQYIGGGINLDQFNTTASYQAHDLTGIDLANTNLAGANFAGFKLTDANFTAATLTGANITNADLSRHAYG